MLFNTKKRSLYELSPLLQNVHFKAEIPAGVQTAHNTLSYRARHSHCYNIQSGDVSREVLL